MKDERLSSSEEPNYFVHESSYVDQPCEIGRGTSIWHFCHIMRDCSIGERCRIGQNVVISPGVRIGNNVKIQNNVSIYTGVVLEDDVFCGPSMVFTNVTTPRSAYPRNTADDYAETVVKRGASIGANATIVCGNSIGEHAMIGAGSVVTRNVPPYALVFGSPARVRGWVCECGLKLVKDALATPDLADSDESENARVNLKCDGCGKTYRNVDGKVDRTS